MGSQAMALMPPLQVLCRWPLTIRGILGVYIMAAPLGSLTDRHGPRLSVFLALTAALLHAVVFS
jgi:hypothetical protein